MSTSNSEQAQDLTQEEQILHHHAAMIKKDLEAYHAYSRSGREWKDLFKKSLARLFLQSTSVAHSQIHLDEDYELLCQHL
jgi:hypothetical protein